MNLSRSIASYLGCALTASIAVACASADSDAAPSASNPGFESAPCQPAALCDWTVAGDVRSVETWHSQDHGIELLGAPVTLSQRVDPFPAEACVRFELIADLAASSNVVVELDFDDDGQLEYADVLPASQWALLTYQHEVPPGAERLRIVIVKRAVGRAVLARLDLAAGPCHP
jgi:hypothetical protein